MILHYRKVLLIKESSTINIKFEKKFKNPKTLIFSKKNHDKTFFEISFPKN